MQCLPGIRQMPDRITNMFAPNPKLRLCVLLNESVKQVFTHVFIKRVHTINCTVFGIYVPLFLLCTHVCP